MVKIQLENIFVINLDSSKKRLQTFKIQADSIQMPYTRWPAIDGRKLTIEDFRKMGASYWALNTFTKKRKGELGCYFSHLSLWQHIQPAKKNSGVLIFEDDVRFSDTFESSLGKVLQSVPADWDIVCLGFESAGFFSKPSGFIRKLKDFWGCHAYILRNSSIPKLLPYLTIAGEPIDTILQDLGSRHIINIYSPEKAIAFPGDQPSTIVPQ